MNGNIPRMDYRQYRAARRLVHECSYDENKTRRQDIEIYYSFVGKVDLPE